MKHIFLILSCLFVVSTVNAGWIEENGAGCQNVLWCSNLNSTGTITSAGTISATTLNISGVTTHSANTVCNSSLTVRGTITLTDGTATLNTKLVKVSTGTAAVDSIYIMGAVTALPTTGYSRGTLCFLTSDVTVYVATETVVGIQSWKPVW